MGPIYHAKAIAPAPQAPKLDYSKIADVEVDGINTRDYPDFVDAYIAAASYDGREMTDAELDVLNGDSGYVYECVIERVF